MRAFFLLVSGLAVAGCGTVLGDFTVGHGDDGDGGDAEVDATGNDGTTRDAAGTETGATDGGGMTDTGGGNGDGPTGSDGPDDAGETGDGSATPKGDGGGPVALVFLSDGTYQGTSFTSAQGADQRCDEAARDAGLGPGFKAWVSAPGSDAHTRMNLTSQPIRLLDRTTVVANGGGQLSSGGLAHQIDLTPSMTRIEDAPVWTGTHDDGTSANLSSTCNAWIAAGSNGVVGFSGHKDQGWTDYDTVDCKQSSRLYCFGPDN